MASLASKLEVYSSVLFSVNSSFQLPLIWKVNFPMSFFNQFQLVNSVSSECIELDRFSFSVFSLYYPFHEFFSSFLTISFSPFLEHSNSQTPFCHLASAKPTLAARLALCSSLCFGLSGERIEVRVSWATCEWSMRSELNARIPVDFPISIWFPIVTQMPFSRFRC